MYNVSGFVKPFGTSTQIISSCQSLSDLNDSDVIVLSFGSNDKNPHKLYTNTCNILSKYKKNKIFLLSVHYNPYLNVKKLNYELESLAKHYINCKFIKIDYNRPIQLPLVDQIATRLNSEIDYPEYIETFIKKVYMLHKNKISTSECRSVTITKKNQLKLNLRIIFQ